MLKLQHVWNMLHNSNTQHTQFSNPGNLAKKVNWTTLDKTIKAKNVLESWNWFSVNDNTEKSQIRTAKKYFYLFKLHTQLSTHTKNTGALKQSALPIEKQLKIYIFLFLYVNRTSSFHFWCFFSSKVFPMRFL